MAVSLVGLVCGVSGIDFLLKKHTPRVKPSMTCTYVSHEGLYNSDMNYQGG